MTAVPRLLLVTDRRQTASRSLEEIVAQCTTGGIGHVLVRERDLSPIAYEALLDRVQNHVGPGVTLLTRDARPGSPACQLSSNAPWPAHRPALVGRSVHDADDVWRATEEGADFVVLGPYAATASKPGYGPALGLPGVRALVDRAAGLPVLAIGGIHPTDLRDLATAGAAGAAVMGPLMGAADPESLASEYVDAARAFDGR